MELVKSILVFIGGLGMFLYGMHVMAEGLQKSAGAKTKKMMGYLTNHRLMGVLIGALVTAIIQSSSATTVMVVGFVNAGILNLVQAVGVIMGANIGTTMTAWLVSMSEGGDLLKPDTFAPLLLGVGAFLILFTKKRRQTQCRVDLDWFRYPVYRSFQYVRFGGALCRCADLFTGIYDHRQ